MHKILYDMRAQQRSCLALLCTKMRKISFCFLGGQTGRPHVPKADIMYTKKTSKKLINHYSSSFLCLFILFFIM